MEELAELECLYGVLLSTPNPERRDDGGRGSFQGIGPGNCEMGQRGKRSHPRLALCRYVHLMVPVTNFLFCRDVNVGSLPVFRRGGNSGPTGWLQNAHFPSQTALQRHSFVGIRLISLWQESRIHLLICT
jgi:hypothetical protein